MKPVLFLKSVEIIIFRNYNGELLKELAYILATLLMFATILKKYTYFWMHEKTVNQKARVCVYVCVWLK